MMEETDFMAFAQSLINELAQNGVSPGTLEAYSSSLNSFKRFYETNECKRILKRDTIPILNVGTNLKSDTAFLGFSEITGSLLKGFQDYLLGCKLKKGTVSCYMRYLRAIYNRGVRKGLCQQTYPFKAVYTNIPKTEKRALPVDILLELLNMDLSKKRKLAMARDLFLFSFAACGMALVDIIYLRKEDIKNGYVLYKRHKSRAPIGVKVTPFMQKVIERWGILNSPYVFPFLQSLDEEECHREYKNSINRLNRQLHNLGRMLPTPVNLTSYMARHSWATIAHNLLVNTSIISSSMGHSSERTTQIYLASLDTHKRDMANEFVTGFLWKGADAIKTAIARADAIASGQILSDGFIGGGLSEKEAKKLIKGCIKESIRESLKEGIKECLLELLSKDSKNVLHLLLDFLHDDGYGASPDTKSTLESIESTPEENNPEEESAKDRSVMNNEKINMNNNDINKNSMNNSISNDNKESNNSKKNNSCKVITKQGNKVKKTTTLLDKMRQNHRADECGFLCKKSSKSAAKLKQNINTSKFSGKK